MKETLSAYLSALKGKRVAVLGAGVSNTPLIDLLLDAGVAVTVRDGGDMAGFDGDRLEHWRGQGAKLRFGSGYLEELTEEVIFRTPGLMPHHPALAAAVERGDGSPLKWKPFFTFAPPPLSRSPEAMGKQRPRRSSRACSGRRGSVYSWGGTSALPF